ncbi:hypothetical protein V2J09_019680 [Rumex salicifolius]
MAVGKNKRISKGKKGGKKKITDPFAKKDWYDVKAPSSFNVRSVGKTLVTRTQGTKIASEGLKHRVFEVSLADLQNDEDQFFRKIRLRAEDVQGRNVLTNFWGMDFTTDKLRSLVRKWQTLIEAHVDVKTTDNYTLRMFCIGFTKRRPNQVKRTTYAQSSQIRQIRRKMREIMVNQASSSDLKELVAKFIPESIGKEIEKATSGIYPLQNVYVRKVKILKAPKFDLGRLMEVHGDYSEDVGVKVDRPADEPMAEGEAAPEIISSQISNIHSVFLISELGLAAKMSSVKIGPAGHSVGQKWDHKAKTHIIQIMVSYGNRLNSLQFQYLQDGRFLTSDVIGAKIFTGPGFHAILLDYPSEYVTGVSGNYDSSCIQEISFHSNKKTYGPFRGSDRSNNIKNRFSFMFGPLNQFGGFHGTHDSELVRSIGVYFNPITAPPTKHDPQDDII